MIYSFVVEFVNVEVAASFPQKAPAYHRVTKREEMFFGIKTSRAEGLLLVLFKPSLIALTLRADKVGCFFFWM